MIDIYSENGEIYSFDENTERIYKDNILIPKSVAEPVYSGNDQGEDTEFSGIFLKTIGKILSRSGKISNVSDIETVV